MNEDRIIYWIWLAELFGAGSKTLSMLVQKYSDPKLIYDKKANDLVCDDFFTEKRIENIKSKLKNDSLEHAEEIIEKCNKLGISVITPECFDYPGKLKTVRDFPVVLYCRGRLPENSEHFLCTIVGTRSMTDYGRRIAYTLGAGIVLGGGVIVSGMALGADSMALIGALESGGSVIAVLGSGVDVVYPREHSELYQKIIKNGAVISEYPPGTPPSGRNFPVRNRIMSGLSDATVVVEADMQSGALITARLCLEQGRRLFAVPGKVGESGAEGPNSLIREGALPVLTPEDVLTEFAHDYRKTLSVDRAHSLLKGVNFENLSKDAMSRTRIGTGVGNRNYYGVGSYGGRLDEYEKEKQRNSDAESKISDDTPKKAVEKKASTKANAKDEKSEKSLASFFSRKKADNIIKNEKQIVNSDKNFIPSKKIELDMLDESEIKVYNRMKPNVPILPDELANDEQNVSDVMSALTILEMAGAVESGGGGYYMRISPDDIMQSQND
jgi:DNA processing protein